MDLALSPAATASIGFDEIVLQTAKAKKILSELPRLAEIKSIWEKIDSEELKKYRFSYGEKPYASKGYRTEIAGFKIEVLYGVHFDRYKTVHQQFMHVDVNIEGNGIRESVEGEGAYKIFKKIVKLQNPQSSNPLRRMLGL